MSGTIDLYDRDRDPAVAFRGMSEAERPDFKVRDQDAESRFALGYRQSELVERAAGHCGARPTLSARSDFGVARIVGVFDATIGVSAAQPFFRGP